MTKNKLFILFTLALVLASLVFFNSKDYTDSSDQISILSKVNGEDISNVSIQRGDKVQSLAVVDESWVLLSKNNYPANVSKIRAMFLKLLDLKSSQILKPSKAGLKKLGLDDEGVKSVFAKVVFKNSEGSKLGGLYLGKQRLTKPGKPADGQYVREIDSDVVYLISSPVSLVVEDDEWLESNVLNVLSKNIYKVEQYSENDLIFSLKRKGAIAFYSNKSLSLDLNVPLGKQVNDSVVSQVSSGLENLRFADVFLRENKNEFVLNKKTKFFLTSGLVYTVSSAESKDDSVAAHFDVHFDQALVDEIKALEVEQKLEKSLALLSKEEAKIVKEFSSLEFSSEEEAKSLSTKYSKWIYEFAGFQGKKFRKDKEELFKDKE